MWWPQKFSFLNIFDFILKIKMKKNDKSFQKYRKFFYFFHLYYIFFIIVTLNDLNIKNVVVAADFSLYIFSQCSLQSLKCSAKKNVWKVWKCTV